MVDGEHLNLQKQAWPMHWQKVENTVLNHDKHVMFAIVDLAIVQVVFKWTSSLDRCCNLNSQIAFVQPSQERNAAAFPNRGDW